MRQAVAPVSVAAGGELGDFLFAYVRHSAPAILASMYALIAMDGEARASPRSS